MRVILFLLISSMFLGSGAFGALDDTVQLKSERISIRLDPRYFGEVSLSYQEIMPTDSSESMELLPSMHLRGKVGLQFWKGRGEAFLSGGAIKLPDSIKFIQKRPYLEVDFYPLLGPYGQVAQYHVIHAPFSDATYQKSYGEPEQQGAIYTIGLAPTLILPLRNSWFHVDWKIGTDIWTRLYSRSQKISSQQVSPASFSLLERDGILEDEDPTWQVLASAGLSVSPLFLKNMLISFQTYRKTTQYPYYSYNGQWDTHYKVSALSYHRVQVNLGLASRLVLSGDLYYFYQGIAEDSKGSNPKGHRGIVKMTYHL